MTQVSPLWTTDIPEGWSDKLIRILNEAGSPGHQLQVFFRSDDIAETNQQFTHLMQLFTRHQAPLCLAVVPAWMNRQRWDEMAAFDCASPLWCWHQHGYSHTNHEMKGKKCEFGNSRDIAAVKNDLLMGRERLSTICGSIFYPVFTPPWNRCGRETLDLLSAMNYKAVSRSAGAVPPAPPSLPDLAVNVDLHTRREQDSQLGWNNLLLEFTKASRTGRVGIMLHHQLINKRGFHFLDQLLHILHQTEHLTICNFRDIL